MASALLTSLCERAKAAETLEDTTIVSKDYSCNKNWRCCRFEDGDVVVKLTRHPSGWLLLSSSALAEASPVLAKSFSKEWNRAKTVVYPRTGETVRIFTLSLVYDFYAGTWFLDSETSPRGIFQEELDRLHVPLGPYDDDEELLEELRAKHGRLLSTIQTVIDLQSFFAILCGESPQLADLLGPDAEESYSMYPINGEPRIYMARHMFKHINNILCYANFYQCFALVAAYLKSLLMDDPDIWEACEQYSWLIIKTAEALRWQELYDDCLRHIFRHHSTFGPGSPIRFATLGLTVDSFQDNFYRAMAWHEQVIQEIRHALATVHLPAIGDPKYKTWGGWDGEVYDEESFSDRDELAALIASGIYSNSPLARCGHVAQPGCYSDTDIWPDTVPLTAPERDLPGIYDMVMTASRSQNPAKILDGMKPEEAALKMKLAAICDTIAMTTAIRKNLSLLVIDASQVLQNAFEANYHTGRPKLTPAHHPSTEYFTNYDITEEDRPWQEPYEWEGEPFDMVHGPHQPASGEWLDALEFFELDVTVD
ncbi:hypothetical protein M409DRAFT_22184 [Zasmidium cellare ATCC 36951]|uniref:Uncharacterized protein n=1 Tax=Zasmidium cellare ATCC 36951 TaxID=1080233 RepID=A0A6A6CL74_ZASCE|nr:uncharacterized protein M409DRAFT_22184 [Zasmidium cellare ATCC 36951]KAF2167373.1 hypothetical protein M409DRAFT_22184 [Zasmidium cellare ATCC 36951]